MSTAGEVKVKVTSDMTEVHRDLNELETHMEQMVNTIKRLESNGVDINLKIKLQPKTMWERMFNFRR